MNDHIHLRYYLPLTRLDAYQATFASEDESLMLLVPREHWQSEGRPTHVSFSPYVGLT